MLPINIQQELIDAIVKDKIKPHKTDKNIKTTENKHKYKRSKKVGKNEA